MIFINPIEILELEGYSVGEIDSLLIKKAKRKLFADIELSDDNTLNYKGIPLTKTDCESAIEKLEKSDNIVLCKYLAIDNQTLNKCLVNGDLTFFTNYKHENIYEQSYFVEFISPYFAPHFDKALVNSFRNKDVVTTRKILGTQNLITNSDKHTAFKSTSLEISDKIKAIEEITRKIKNNETSWTQGSISGLLFHVRKWAPIEILNLLPKYFQSQLNKTADALNLLQIAIWEKLYNPFTCKQILDILFSLEIESVSKQTFEKNYEIVIKSFKKNHIDKLIALLNSYENKPKNISNAKELLYKARTYLFNIKSISFKNDNIYVSLSTRVASVAQSFIIEEVNYTQSSNRNFNNLFGNLSLSEVLKNAWEATQLIGSLEMQNDFIINSYNPNKETLQNICNNHSVATPNHNHSKIPQYNFTIIDGIITHTDKDSKPLPISSPFIKSELRYIGLNLTVETFGNHSINFDLKYIQPDGTVKKGTSSPEKFSFSERKVIDVSTRVINLSGWGNADKSTYIIGTHHIEVWIDNCMIYRKSFEVDITQEEKSEIAKKEAEKRERERIEADKRKEQAKIDEEKRKEQAKIVAEKVKEKKVRVWCLWIMGIFIGLAVIFAIWGLNGLKTLGIILGVLFVLLLWILGSSKK